MALGGKGLPIINNNQIESMKILFEQGMCLKDISKELGIDERSIRHFLHKYRIDTSINGNRKSIKAVCASTGGISYDFYSERQAANFVINDKRTKSLNVRDIGSKIGNAAHNNKFIYGFNWDFI